MLVIFDRHVRFGKFTSKQSDTLSVLVSTVAMRGLSPSLLRQKLAEDLPPPVQRNLTMSTLMRQINTAVKTYIADDATLVSSPKVKTK